MTLIVVAIAILPAVTSVSLAQSTTSEMIYLVKQIDHLGTESVSGISRQEYSDLGKRIRMENLYSMRAHRIAESNWMEDNEGKYPGRGLSRRSAIKMVTCRTLEEAMTKIAAIEKSNKFAQGKKDQSRQRLANALKQNHNNRYNNHNNINPVVIRTAHHRAASDKKRKEVYDRLNKALPYYKSALDQLIDNGVAYNSR